MRVQQFKPESVKKEPDSVSKFSPVSLVFMAGYLRRSIAGWLDANICKGASSPSIIYIIYQVTKNKMEPTNPNANTAPTPTPPTINGNPSKRNSGKIQINVAGLPIADMRTFAGLPIGSSHQDRTKHDRPKVANASPRPERTTHPLGPYYLVSVDDDG